MGKPTLNRKGKFAISGFNTKHSRNIFLKILLCAFTTGLASFYAATSWAQSKTENCYFSIDNETIFNGPCNETISEIEKNFVLKQCKIN